ASLLPLTSVSRTESPPAAVVVGALVAARVAVVVGAVVAAAAVVGAVVAGALVATGAAVVAVAAGGCVAGADVGVRGGLLSSRGPQAASIDSAAAHNKSARPRRTNERFIFCMKHCLLEMTPTNRWGNAQGVSRRRA